MKIFIFIVFFIFIQFIYKEMENNLNPSNNQTPIKKGNSLENILKSNEKIENDETEKVKLNI